MRNKRKHKYRGYDCPLEYYLAHTELHELGRFDLLKKDSGLYATLLRHGDLEKAIPNVKPGYQGLPQDEVKSIIDAYDKFNGNSRRAALSLLYSPPTFIKYWRLSGFKIRKRGGRF